MKKITLALTFLILSTSAWANITIQTDSRVEILAVNQEINNVPKKGAGDLKIENGINQILVRVTSMVDGNGGKSKFNSNPIVLVFEANDETLTLESPFAIRSERDVERFNNNVDVKISSRGQEVSKKLDVIIDKSFGIFKDYDAMLVEYNLSGSPASIAPKSTLKKEATTRVTDDTPAEVAQSLFNMEQGFLEMTPEQRQEFVSWAVKHINH
ncbi:DUF2057 domain-containing protein [Vibrio sonorensis]|uniref:DUF2057 domain-containing protein n=1 Tax=Vibrio sonorensis TaxID=1004316 RepID=UPI0008DA56AE|nr:DUF2057 domain-containing protein [Vibrio sonorensis]